MPRGSRQILTRKWCSCPFPLCAVFAEPLQGVKGIPANFDRQSCSYPFPFCVVFAGVFCRVPRGSRQILTHKWCSCPFPFCVVFAGLLQVAKGIPANFDPQMVFLPFSVLCVLLRSRRMLIRKWFSCPFPFCLICADLLQGAKRIPANLDRQSCSYPFQFCLVFAGLLQGVKGIPANSDRQSCSYPFPFCGICRTFARCQGDPGKF